MIMAFGLLGGTGFEALGLSPLVLVLFCLLIIWSTVWKLIGLWKSGRHNQLAWFIVIGVLNTAGILPIIYLLFFQKKAKVRKK